MCTTEKNSTSEAVEPLKQLLEIRSSLPKPVAVDWTEKQWFAKINEEVMEAHEMAVQENIIRTAEEITDVITVCTSYLECHKIKLRDRMYLQRCVNDKNKRRGYIHE